MLDLRTMQLTDGGRSVPLRTVEHQRSRTPELKLCRDTEKDPMKCRRATVERLLEVPEDSNGKLQRKDNDGGCRAGDVCCATGFRRRHRTPKTVDIPEVPTEKAEEDRKSHGDSKDGNQVLHDNSRGRRDQAQGCTRDSAVEAPRTGEPHRKRLRRTTGW